MNIDNSEFRKVLLANAISNEDFTREVSPYVKPEYFKETYERTIWKYINGYLTEYNSVPSPSVIKIGLEGNKNLSAKDIAEGKKFLKEQKEIECAPVDFLKDKTEEWCKLRGSVLAVIKAMDVIDGKDRETQMDALPDILSQAVSIAFDKRIGTNYLKDADERWEMYRNKLDRIPTGLQHFDDILGGGYPIKSLGIFMAGTGVGKSLTMCHSAASALKKGYNVLYISMEMSEEKLSERIDTNLMQMEINQIKEMDKSNYVSRFDRMKEKQYGELIIKEYGTGSASIVHFNRLLQDLEMKQGFKPHVIFVDYLNICASSRAGKNSNSYERVKFIAEELRSLAVEREVSIISATQANRGGIDNSELDLTNTSESIALPQTADFMFALSATTDMRKDGIIKCTQLKNRFGDPMWRHNHMIGVDYSLMTLFDLTSQPAHINAQNNTNGSSKDVPDVPINSFGMGERKEQKNNGTWE